MVVPLDTLLSRSEAHLKLVRPFLKEYALELIKRAYSEGIYVQISSGYRSLEEQAKIYGQGRKTFVYNGKEYGRLYDGNKKLSIVSNAKPGTSMHNYGVAVDYFLVTDDGQNSIWKVDHKWKRVAELAKGMGAEWGGDWVSFRDYPHLQWNQKLTTSQLASGKHPSYPSLKTQKEEVRMFKPPTKALKEGTVQALKTAKEKNIISSQTWIEKAEKDQLTMDEAVSLAFLISNGKIK